MFLLDPPPTAYDLHFEVTRIPVRVHPFFWLTAVLIGGVNNHPSVLLTMIAVIFVSILLHELGHALTMRWFGQSPRIVLYAMGGFATASGPSGYGMSSARHLAPLHQILVLFAGPGAGFLLAALIFAGIKLSGGEVFFEPSFPFFWGFALNIDDPMILMRVSILLDALIQVNILWGLMNLVPVYPLDGGQIARELLVWKDPWQGVIRSLWLSVVAGGIMVVLALRYNSIYLAILFGMLAYQSYLALQQVGGTRGGRWM